MPATKMITASVPGSVIWLVIEAVRSVGVEEGIVIKAAALAVFTKYPIKVVIISVKFFLVVPLRLTH